MKVVSVNIGKRQTINWKGKTEETGIFKYPVKRAIYLESEDVNGDAVVDRKYHGGIDMACYIYSADHYPFWKEKYPELNWEYGMFGENVTIEGLKEEELCIGDIYQLGEARVQISQPRHPCYKLGVRFNTQAVLKEFINAPYPGTYLRVLENGQVKAGDEMNLIDSHEDEISLLDTYRFRYELDDQDKAELERILSSEVVPEDCKEGLRKRLNN